MARATSDSYPSFFAVGPQRTATTWLREALRSRVCFPAEVPETMFFDRHYDNGESWYLRHFDPCGSSVIRGEVAPTYFHSPEARGHILESIPTAKILITLRDPVDRLLSLYRLMRHYGMTSGSFLEAVRTEPQMLESSRYAHHVLAWKEMFGNNQVLVLLHEDLKSDPETFLSEVFAFLELGTPSCEEVEKSVRRVEGVARWPRLAAFAQETADWLRGRGVYAPINLARRLGLNRLVYGGGGAPPDPDPGDLEAIRELLAPEMQRLESILSRDLEGWWHTRDHG